MSIGVCKYSWSERGRLSRPIGERMFIGTEEGLKSGSRLPLRLGDI